MIRLVTIILVFLFTVAGAGIVDAVPISSYLDPSLAGGTTIDFESVTQTDYSSLTVAGVTITRNSGVFQVSTAGNEYVPPADVNMHFGGMSGDVFTFTLNTDVSAFGFQIGATNHPWSLSAYGLGGVFLESIMIPDQVETLPYPFAGFYGIDQGSTLISYLELTTDRSYTDYIVLDDIKYANNSNLVPEPTTMLLLGTGLIGLAGARRRMKK